MGSALYILSLAFTFANKLYDWILNHFYISVCIFLVGFLYLFKEKHRYAKDFIHTKNGYIILDGKFEKGKTRFLALLAKEAKEKGMVVICNYYNKCEDIRWNSVNDLINVLTDLWTLGECQNFTEEDIKVMYDKEGKTRINEKLQVMRNIKKKYKNIPFNGFHTRFLLQGDEMQNIFFNREAMTNFSGEKKGLLKLLHQIRHYNGLASFALTDASEMDVKFRKISSYYLHFGTMLQNIILKYTVFTFERDAENNFDIDKSQKVTAVPVYAINGYALNQIINKIESKIKKRIKFRFKELGFKSKFNADPDYDIYQKKHLFEYLNDYYDPKRFHDPFRFSNN